MSQNAKLASRDTTSLAFTYKFDDTAGSGVDVYVVGKHTPFFLVPSGADHVVSDTGILTTHVSTTHVHEVSAC